MKFLDLDLQRGRWQSRSLCRRYAAVVFSTISNLPVKTRPFENRTICWAFGSLIQGEQETLGAWSLESESAVTTTVFADLRNRGVEFVRYGLGNLEDAGAAFLSSFRFSALYPSVEQTLASSIGEVKPCHRVAMSSLLRALIDESVAEPAMVSLPETSSEELRQKYPEILERWGEAVARFRPLLALPDPYREIVRSVDQTAISMQEGLMRAIHRHGPFTDSAEAFDFVVDALVRADHRLERASQAAQLVRHVLGSRAGRFARLSGGPIGTPTMA